MGIKLKYPIRLQEKEQQKVQVVALACTKAPKGTKRWTLDLLTKKAHAIGLVISRSALWEFLLRNDTKPWREKNVVYP